jgi:hypothetical protein
MANPQQKSIIFSSNKRSLLQLNTEVLEKLERGKYLFEFLKEDNLIYFGFLLHSMGNSISIKIFKNNTHIIEKNKQLDFFDKIFDSFQINKNEIMINKFFHFNLTTFEAILRNDMLQEFLQDSYSNLYYINISDMF